MPVGVYERKKKPIEERFWARVNKNTGSECWEFTGRLCRFGYGIIDINGKGIKAHRLSYELHYGKIPEGMHILHSCDNRKCILPDHLSIGNHFDNMQDKVNRNRQHKPKGTLNGRAKLNENQIKDIKLKINLGVKQRDIAKEYNVGYTIISAINTGKLWKHIN